MPLMLMLAAGGVLLALVALLILQRRRQAADGEDAGDGTPVAGIADAAGEPGPDQWRRPTTGEQLKAVLHGGRAGLALLRDGDTEIFVGEDGETVCLVHWHDSPYGGRPNWEHIAALTLSMGQAERCWPGSDLSGVLQYTDRAVPVQYSPRLLADLEDETAPSPHGTTPA